MGTRYIAVRVARAIARDLDNRRGMSLSNLDDGLEEEIIQAWADLIQHILVNEDSP